jgi:hypothetical protein
MYNGEYVKYNANKIYASGNIDAGNYLLKDSSKTLINGTVYFTHEVVPSGKRSTGGLLLFTKRQLGKHIVDLSVSDPTNFGSFKSLLVSSSLWNNADSSIIGTVAGGFYTVFAPNNASIVNAVKARLLPGNWVTGVPNFNPSATASKDTVTRFLQYHILNKATVVTDGVKSGAFATLLQNSNGDPTFITVINQLNSIELRDAFNNSVFVVLANSNNLSNRTVIHSINNYLKYQY